MNTANTTSVNALRYFLIAGVVALFVWALFWLDHETKSISDLFRPGNLVAFGVYFIPTFLICLALNRRFSRKNKNSQSLLKALLIGIPLSFTLVIIALLMLRNFN